MPAQPVINDNQSRWDTGITDYEKANDPNGVAFIRSLNYRDDPRQLTLLPKTVKESGSTVLGLPKDGDLVGDDLYYYDADGRIYKRTVLETHVLMRSVTESHGNGMKYYAEDGFLYYTRDKVIGRMGYVFPSDATVDTWEDGIDTDRWGKWGGAPGQITTSGRTLTIASTAAANYYGIEQTHFNLTGKYITSQVIDVGSRSLTSWEIYPCYALINNSNQLFWYIDKDNNLRAYKKVGGVNTILASGTYSSATHKYFRIREYAGTTYFDYSTDFATWVQFASTPNPFALTNLFAGLYAGTYDTEASTTSAIFGPFTSGADVSSATFVDDFLGSEGGVPLNTHSLDLEAGSSQYAAGADSATTSITSDLAIEATIKPESLPAAGSSMVLFSKWDVNSNLRSYKFEIYGASGYFGAGTDGALTISANTTEAPIDSACTGTSGSNVLSATNASFAAGQEILIHQTRGSGAGTMQRNTIASYSTGTITLVNNLNATYTTGAQVRVLPQYTTVTVNSGITYTAKAWNGTVGGILAFIASGAVTITGTITATGKGFRGGTAGNSSPGTQGEGTGGAGAVSTSANGNGGGGANLNGSAGQAGGGGGGNATAGANGTKDAPARTSGSGGNSVGSIDLTSIVFGGGGGGGSSQTSGEGKEGGNGGGIVFISGTTITVTGAISANGSAGGVDGGSGAGGSILLKAQTATLGAAIITASAGTPLSLGGAGSTGRVHLDYLTSYTGTTTPTLDYTQDSTLVTSVTYQLRLGLSSNGTAEEFLARNANIVAGAQTHVAVSWDASAATAEFMQNGASLGSATGAVTSLNDNASLPAIGADYNSTARNFYDGLIDEVRLWSVTRTVAQILANKETQIATNTPGLNAYYKLNNDYTDATANANDLTSSGGPVFSTEVAFSSPTTRVDLDQSLDTSGNTYALTTAINEGATHRQTFVPTKDPQKSIEINVSDTGDDSDWTITVHDALNRVVASKTIAHADLRTGDVEFVFDKAWRPIRGATYHFHITATTTTGTPLIVSTTSNDLETGDFHTYYQFLVEDTQYHPIEHMLNFLAIGNGRYVATYAADSGYSPHKLVLPPDWNVRCFAKWNEFLAIGCWKRNTVTGTDQGIIFFWDGISEKYSSYLTVPEGAINAMLASRGILYIWAGYHGDILQYTGGAASVIKRAPKMTTNTYLETLPKAVTMWDALLRWGVGGDSNSDAVERGVYTWEQTKRGTPENLSYDYPISTGNRASTGVQIGFMIPLKKKLLIGWRDNLSYGMDVVDPTGTPFADGTVERNIKDFGAMYHAKKALLVRADFKTLASGEQVRVKYKLDRADEWTVGDWVDSSNAEPARARLEINKGDHKEIQIAADLMTTGSTSPTLYELVVEEDLKISEKIL